MEIICEKCKAKLSIPDEKIPRGRVMSIACPKCKEKLTLGTRTLEPEKAALESYEEGQKLALVAENDPGQIDKLRGAIEGLGYKYIAVENTGQAISKMRFHRFDLVILSDQFDGIELGQSAIRQYLNLLSISIRRRMFVALIGDTFNTMDNMMAFAMSANLVVNRRDLDNLTGILKNAISENDKFYKVFIDTLTEVGKA
ncbi:MAG: zinc-ribbon domain-containing protein [Deltaproteobacteria bacterium]|nr:zinc-ribbon domain-containing protein [Deltaproteobacteria bacterium]